MKLSLLTAGGLLVALVATGCSFLSSDPASGLGLGGTPTCETVPCGQGGTTMKVCTSTTAEGTCSGISYAVGGKTFSCGSCTDCEQAATQASEVCETGRSSAGPMATPGQDGGSSAGPVGPSGATTCAASVACGTTGATYQECVTTGASGTCEAITMKTSDGQRFACTGCDCTQAAEQLASYCEEGSGSGGGVDSGTAGSFETTCSAQVACGTGGITYDACTTVENGACSQVTYQTSDGQSFTCNGCSDCTSAVTQLESYCGSTSGGGGTGVGGTTCSGSVTCGSNGTTYEVCTTTDGSGACSQIVYQTSDGQSFDCSGCSDCSTAAQQVASYCSDSSGGGQQCGGVTCGSTASCCTCSGQQICYTLPPGDSCADIGAGCS